MLSIDYDNGTYYNQSLANFSDIYDECIDQNITEPQYYSTKYRIIGTFFNTIIFFVGIIGNMMVVLVVSKTRSMHCPTNCYLVSLAVADSLVLMAAVPNEVLSYYLPDRMWLWGNFGCSVLVFNQFLGINASSLCLVAFTLERYVAICHPMRAHTECTVRRARRIIYMVWSISVTYSSPWLFLTSTQPLCLANVSNAWACDYKLPREHYLLYYSLDLVVFYVMPLLVSCILYICIARVLFSRNIVKTFGKNGTIKMETSTVPSAKKQVVKMLSLVVAVFAILWLPYRGLMVYNSFAALFEKEKYMDLWYLMFAKTCVYINCAINPILYNAMSYKFRLAFKRVLYCGAKNESHQYRQASKRRRSLTSISTKTSC